MALRSKTTKVDVHQQMRDFLGDVHNFIKRRIPDRMERIYDHCSVKRAQVASDVACLLESTLTDEELAIALRESGLAVKRAKEERQSAESRIRSLHVITARCALFLCTLAKTLSASVGVDISIPSPIAEPKTPEDALDHLNICKFVHRKLEAVIEAAKRKKDQENANSSES